MSAGLPVRPLQGGLKAATALLLVAGLFLLGVLLTPPAPVGQAVFAQPAVSTPQVPQPAAVRGGGGWSGTLSSFTALIPEVIVVNIPMVGR